VGLTLLGPGTIQDPLVLLLEVVHVSRAILSTVRLGGNGNSVVVWLVLRELLEPNLREVPESSCGVLTATGCGVGILARIGTDVKSVVFCSGVTSYVR
jgi:hypothetical protein